MRVNVKQQDGSLAMSSGASQLGTPREGARREFATHASRRRSRLAVQSQPWAAQRLGGGWGKKDSSKFNLLKMTNEFNPIPTLTLPLKGRELDARRFLNIVSLLGKCVHTLALDREGDRGRQYFVSHQEERGDA